MKRFYCTYFDKNYLVKAVAMMTSLRKKSNAEVQVFAVCHDEISRVLLDALQLPGVVTVPMHEIEQGDAALLEAKHSRQLVEYFWTCTPTIILRLLERNPAIKQITYLDADLFFYSDPEPIFSEMGDAPVLIHEHRFSDEMVYLQAQAGRFNVGLLSFCQNDQAFSVLKWWRARCNEWCYMHYEAGKMGDQLYLDQWPALFPFVKILQHIGAGVAPWNHQQYEFDTLGEQVRTNQSNLIFYHFHAFSRIKDNFYAPVKHPHYPLTKSVLRHVFVPYIDAVEAALLQVRTVSDGFNFGVNETDNANIECALISKKPDIFTELNWQELAGSWLVAIPENKVRIPHSPEAIFSLNSGERLLDYIARPDIAAHIKQVYFVGCHYFEERDWFFSSFPALEKIYLFEPLPQVYATLVQRFGKDPKVQIFPFAISDQDGTAKFNVTNNLQSSSLLDLKLHKDIFPQVEKSNEVTVVVRSLDSVIREYELPLPDLLYIDVQGAEYQALQGALELALPNTSVVYTEASTIEMYAGAHTLIEVDDLLASVHFRLIGFQDMLATRVHGDALFINQSLYQCNAHPLLARAHQHNLLAQTLIRLGQLEEAEIELRKAMSEGAELSITLENLGKLALIGGDRTLATELFASARQISPNDRALLLLWANSAGRAAFEACQFFINQHPGDTAFFDLASIRLRQSPPVPRVPAPAVSVPVITQVRPEVKPFWQKQEWNSYLQKIWVMGSVNSSELAALIASFSDRSQFDVFLADNRQLQALFSQFAIDPRIALRSTQADVDVFSSFAESPDFLYFASAADAAVTLVNCDVNRLNDVRMVAIADVSPSISENVRVMADYLQSHQFDWQASFVGQPALNLALFVNQRTLALMTVQRAKAQLLNLEAAQHLQQGHLAEAQEVLGQALEEDSLYARTYLNWGRSCELAGQPQAALDSYVHALSLDEEDRSSVLALSKLLSSMGHSVEAEEVLAKFAEKVPADDIVARNAVRNKPRISALVSTYKSAKFIAECLDDLLAQTIADQIEIIVIDANSPENEGEIVAAYQARHNNIRYVRTPERIGIYPAWNIAIEMAQGEYLISASTNDRLCKYSCEVLMAELDADPQLGLVYGDSHFTREPHQDFDTALVHDGQYWPPFNFEQLLSTCMIGCHPMWRRSMHKEFGLFDEQYIAIGDQDMWLRIGEKYPLKHIDFVTGLFWQTSESLSGNSDVSVPEIIKIHKHYQERYTYRQYLKQHVLAQDHLNYYSDRLNSASRTLRVNLVIIDADCNEALLAKTIRSITAQYYSADLSLTILSSRERPNQELNSRFNYVLFEGTPWYILNRIVCDSEFDYFGVLFAGDEFEKHALLVMLDVVLFDLNVKFVCCGHDYIEKSGIYSSPVFFNEYDFSTDVVALNSSFVFIERASFINLGVEFSPAYLSEYRAKLYSKFNESAFKLLNNILYHKYCGLEQCSGSLHLENQNLFSNSVDDGQMYVLGDSTGGTSEKNNFNQEVGYAKYVGTEKSLSVSESKLFDLHLNPDSLPRVLICIIDRFSNTAAVIKTIESLTKQLYSNVSLVVCSDLDSLGGGLDWITTKNSFYTAIVKGYTNFNAFNFVGFVEAGDCFSLNGLLVAMHKIVLNPDWLAVYFDDAEIGLDGSVDFPRFKPDFDINLLCSVPYADGFLLLKSSLIESIDLSTIDFFGSEQIAILLSIYEKYGRVAIGHVAEVVTHLGANISRDLLNPLRCSDFKRMVEIHLSRMGIDSNVLENKYVPGAFNIKYKMHEEPLVSIIIPTKNHLTMLQRCIESILEKTNYANYEIIVVDNNSDDPQVMPYLAELELILEGRLRVLAYPHAFNFSAINNYAVSQASGEYLVLLNNDTAIIQESWLDELLHHALRPDVGIVGAKLLYPDGRIQHAGVVLGLRGPADHSCIGARHDDTGYMHRLQLVQNYSVVTAACLMIRKTIYEQVGGMNEVDFKVSYNDVDLCLKVGELGLQIVWTPFSVVVHEGSVSQLTNVDVVKEAQNTVRFKSEKQAMYAKWQEKIGNDPAYNKNLTLSGKGFEFELRALLTWKPLSWNPLPKVLCHPADQMGCGRYRILQPFIELEDALMITGGLTFELLPAFELAKFNPDVIVYQRQITEQQLEYLQHARSYNSSYKIYEVDDYLPNLPMKSLHREHMPKDILRSMRKALTLVDRFVVSTQELADAYSDLHSNIHVVHNYLPVSIWGNLASKRRQSLKPRVGWAGGISHTGDLELIAGVVKELANEVEWVFFGMCPDKLRPFVHEFHSGVPIEHYPAKLASLNLDLALAPLENNLFNRCKSNLRLLEYGACGYPVVCTDIAPYADVSLPVCRVKNRHKDWVDAIRDAIKNLELTAAVGEELKRVVLRDWMLNDKNLQFWHDAWSAD